jgi:hypothetical protein
MIELNAESTDVCNGTKVLLQNRNKRKCKTEKVSGANVTLKAKSRRPHDLLHDAG